MFGKEFYRNEMVKRKMVNPLFLIYYLFLDKEIYEMKGWCIYLKIT